MQDQETYRYTTIRMPESLEAQLGEIAARNRRSRSSEIILRLEKSIQDELEEHEKAPVAVNG